MPISHKGSHTDLGGRHGQIYRHTQADYAYTRGPEIKCDYTD